MAEAEEEVGLGLGLGLGQGEAEGLSPWEQHSAVISIPRFDYNAPSSLLEHSHSGFLVTCTLKREKSATKEVISILEKYVGSSSSNSSECSESSDANESGKRRKTFSEEIDGECVNNANIKRDTAILGDSGELSKETGLSFLKRDANVERDLVLSLVKLTRSGLILLTFPRNNFHDTVDIVSNVFHTLESGTLRSPLWCHRIFPIQATCNLKEKDLRIVVLKLVQQFVDDERNKLKRPMKFAVGYNRRGIEETEMKILKTTSTDSDLFALLDRNKCFSVVAGAVKDVVADSIVDLNSPELSVLVELLPLSGVPKGSSLVVAVSVLPHNLVSTKPRLCIKALVSDTKTKIARS